MDKKSKILLIILILIIVFSISYTYYQTVVRNQFEIVNYN